MNTFRSIFLFNLLPLLGVVSLTSCEADIPQEALDQIKKKNSKKVNSKKNSGSNPKKATTVLHVDNLVDEEFIDSSQIYSQPCNEDPVSDSKNSLAKNPRKASSEKKDTKQNKTKKSSFKKDKLFDESKAERLRRSKAKMVRTGRLLKKVTPFDETILIFGIRFSVEDFSKYHLKYTLNGERPVDAKTVKVTEVVSEEIPYNSFKKTLAFKKGSKLETFILDKTTLNNKKQRIFCFKIDYSMAGPGSKLEFILKKAGDESSTKKLLVCIPDIMNNPNKKEERVSLSLK